MSEVSNDRIVREKECKELTGLSRTNRFLKEKNGAFPLRRKLGGRAIGWLLSEIQEWQKQQPKRNVE